MTHGKRTAIVNEGPWHDTDGNVIQVKTVPYCLLAVTQPVHSGLGVLGC